MGRQGMAPGAFYNNWFKQHFFLYKNFLAENWKGKDNKYLNPGKMKKGPLALLVFQYCME
jgi:hypothetical protein